MVESSFGAASSGPHPVATQQLVDELHAACGFFDGLIEAVAVFSVDGTLITGNAAFHQLIGGLHRDLAGMHWSAYVVPEERESIERFSQRVFATEGQVEFETQLLDCDGSVIDVAVRLRPARCRENVFGIFAFATEIDPQKTVKKAFLRGRQELRSLFERHPDGLATFTLDGRISRVNRAMEAMTGFCIEELLDRDLETLVMPEHCESFRAMIVRAVPATFDTSMRRKDGKALTISGSAAPVFFDGELAGISFTARDVTSERRVMAELETFATRIQHLCRVATANAGATSEHQIATAIRYGIEEFDFEWAYIAEIDGDGAAVIFTEGLPSGAPVLDPAFMQAVIERDRPLVIADTGNCCPPEDGFFGVRSFAAIAMSVDEQRHAVMVLGSARPHTLLSRTDRELFKALAAVVRAAIERSHHRRRLDELAFYDGLTGLPNRTLLRSRVEEAVHAARHTQQSFAMHFIDFDNFKPVNDRHGHGMGDELLIAMGQRLAEGMRSGDTLARFGGDEFVVLQRDVDGEDKALAFAHRIAENLRQPFVARDQEFTLTVSVGIAMFPNDGETMETLLHHADAALYQAKGAGRNRIVRYLPSMRARR